MERSGEISTPARDTTGWVRVDDDCLIETHAGPAWGICIGVDGQVCSVLVRDDRFTPRYQSYKINRAKVIERRAYAQPQLLSLIPLAPPPLPG